jgi:hypothetical protein
MDRVGSGVETMREASVVQLAGRLTLETIVRFPLVVIAHCWAMFRFTTSTDTSNRRATSTTDRPS